MKTGLSAGDTIVVYLQNPREKIWGQLCDLTPAGVNIRGIDLGSFEDWLRGLVSGDSGIGLTMTFLPMWRIERVILDQSVAGIPGLEDQMVNRTGLNLKQVIEQIEDFSNELDEPDARQN